MITTDKRVLNRRENTNFRNKDKTILQMYEHYLTEIQEHPIRLKYTSLYCREGTFVRVKMTTPGEQKLWKTYCCL